MSPKRRRPGRAQLARAATCWSLLLVTAPAIAYSEGKRLEGGMVDRTLCQQCELPEPRCNCDKYCILCQGQYGIRLCDDGLYYCPDCREACEVRVVN